jgi:hypothetical protein
MKTEEEIKIELAILKSMLINDKRAKLDVTEYQHKITALKWVLGQVEDIFND